MVSDCLESNPLTDSQEEFKMFRHLLRRCSNTDRHPLPRRLHTRLVLEPLEDRTVPTTFTVTNLNDGGAGSLRQAITDANSAADADLITFAAGLTGTINLSLSGADDTNVGGDLDIINPASIQGPGANILTVQQTVANERVFDVQSPAGASVAISGLTITGGNGANFGGGGVLLTTAATLTLSAVEVTANASTMNDGGGVLQAGAGVLSIINSTIANNYSPNPGGGIAIFGGSTTITNSTISVNTSGGESGGGMRVLSGVLTIRNSTITGNGSRISGAGISIKNPTIFAPRPIVTLSSTIVAGNNDSPSTGGDVDGALEAASDHNLIGNSTGLTGITNGVNGNLIGTAATGINPLLGPLQFNGGPTRTHALLAASPALGRGFDEVGLSFDQRGLPFLRHFGTSVDIGAFEAQPNRPHATPPPNPQPTPPNPQPTARAFRAAVQAITLLESSGARLAAFAIGDVNGDNVGDIVVAFRLRKNKLLIATFDGVNGMIVGVFQPFPAASDPRARVKLVTVNLNSDPALEIGVIVTPGSVSLPHITAFTTTGSRIL